MLKFYKTGKPYDIFSNVTDIGFSINIAGRDYNPRSSEAVYQGLRAYSSGKANAKETAEKSFFNDQVDPGGHIQRNGQEFRDNARFFTSDHQTDNTFASYSSTQYTFDGAPDKIDLKEQVMYETLLVKFTQNPAILKALLETGDEHLVEDTQSNKRYDDPFWGNGQKGDGRNALGIALMRAREDLRRELDSTGKIQVRTGFSDEVARSLNIPPSTPPAQTQYVTDDQLKDTTSASTVAEFQNVKRSTASGPRPTGPHPSSSKTPTEPANPTQKKEDLERAQEIKEWRETCMRLRSTGLEKGFGGKDFPAYVIVNNDRKTAMDHYNEIMQKVTSASADPSAHWAGTVSNVAPTGQLQDKLKGPCIFIKFPGDFTADQVRELQELNQKTKAGDEAARKKTNSILSKAPHYHMDENGNISKIPPPEVHFRWKHPERAPFEKLTEWISGKERSDHLLETTGKKQSVFEVAQFGLMVGIIAAVTSPILIPTLGLLSPIAFAILPNFVSNSYKEIIAGHGETMRIKMELEGVTSLGITWKGKPHKEVLWGMLLEMEKLGLSLDKSKTEPHVLAFLEGRPYTPPNSTETWPALSGKELAKFKSKIEQLAFNQEKVKMYTDTRDKPILDKDTQTLESKEKLETEFQDVLQKHKDAKDPAAAALNAKYKSLADADNATKTKQLSEDIDVVAKRAEQLAVTGTELSQSCESYGRLASNPTLFLDAPPVDPRYERLGQKIRDSLLSASERVKDPVKALEMLEDQFKGSSKEMEALLSARTTELNDLIRRNEGAKAYAETFQTKLQEEIKVQKDDIKQHKDDIAKYKEDYSTFNPEGKETADKAIKDLEAQIKSAQGKIKSLEGELKKTKEVLDITSTTETTLAAQSKLNAKVDAFLHGAGKEPSFSTLLQSEKTKQEQIRGQKGLSR